MKKEINLHKSEYYNNRELSWLSFNERVLEEALDKRNPLLERLRFLSIFSSNLDEFFMVRVAGLKDQVQVGFNKPENKAGLTPKQQLKAITKKAHELVEVQYEALQKSILPQLEKEGMSILSIHDLTHEQGNYVESYFEEQIFPVLTPVALDAYRPLPMLLNRSLNLVVVLYDDEEKEGYRRKLGIVQVPAVLERFIELPSTKEGIYECVLLETVISHFLSKLFKGYHVESVTQFRITRNADLTIHEDGAEDLLVEIEKELKKRKWGGAVRLEVSKHGVDHSVVSYLVDELDIHNNDIYYIDGPLDATSYFSFYGKHASEHEHLIFEALIPQPPLDLLEESDIFKNVSQKDILFHHPYESFQPVVDFIEEAAEDPNVLAIKQTLYRVSGDSPIIHALKRAVEKGKQVTVLVELKARFDEENNVQWAKELEKSGCHVIYGMNYLKTHSKITLVVRRQNGKIERFVHLGTGNYNDSTAKFYTDFGLITSNKEIGEDATNFFNYLSGYTDKPEYHHLSVAPFTIREDLVKMIDREIECHKKYKNGRIIAKMNSLTDKHLIRKLYEASMEGVQIDLIIRGTCCLRPGIPHVSENIRVCSIIGRFLEHSRINYFYNNGEENLYLSSADWMTRNMEKRIEIAFPILQKDLKERIKKVIDILLTDNVKAREQDSEGKYTYVIIEEGELKIDSQMILFDMSYQAREKEEQEHQRYNQYKEESREDCNETYQKKVGKSRVYKDNVTYDAIKNVERVVNPEHIKQLTSVERIMNIKA